MFSAWYKQNIAVIKYGLIVVNIFLMISAIRAIVTHQSILSSIDEVKINVVATQEHTDYINNFLAPYLKSEYAPYFFAHENNQIFAGEKIINIITMTGVDIGDHLAELATNTGAVVGSGGDQILEDQTTPRQGRYRYFKELGSSIKRGYESFL